MRWTRWLGLAAVGAVAVMMVSMGDRGPGGKVTPVSAETLEAGIAVSGQGKAVAQPDMATVNLGVSAEAVTASEAMSVAGERMNRVIEKIKSLGIPAQDLQTTDLSLFPQHDKEGRTITGYQARTTVQVTVRDLDKTVWVVDGAVEAGANLSYGISFGLQNAEGLQLQALEDALRSARARADVLAAKLGVRIVGVRGVSDGYGPVPLPVPAKGGARDAAPAAGVAVPVEGGQLTVYERVSVVYDIAQ